MFYYISLICLHVIGNYNILKFFNVEIDEENLLSLLIGDLLTMIYSKNSIYPIIDSPFNTFALFYVEKRLFLSDDFLTVVAVVATFHCLYSIRNCILFVIQRGKGKHKIAMNLTSTYFHSAITLSNNVVDF